MNEDEHFAVAKALRDKFKDVPAADMKEIIRLADVLLNGSIMAAFRGTPPARPATPAAAPTDPK